jgi:hypothetical protein
MSDLDVLTRIQSFLVAPQATRPVRSLPPNLQRLSDRHPEVRDGLPTEYAKGLATRMTLTIQQFEDVSLIIAIDGPEAASGRFRVTPESICRMR